jgi:phosphoglycolate phosphatase
MFPSPKAVIFDLDGTLLNTLEDLADAVNLVLTQSGLPPHPVDAYRHFVGEGVSVMIRKAAAPADPDLAPLLERMKIAYGTGWARKTVPYPGIMPMLERLGALGIPLAVLSNKPEPFTRIMVEHFFPGGMFANIRGQREGVPRKPDPRAALDIAGHFGVPPESVWFMGDSKTDMETAARAGMFSVGVTWGFRDEAELRAHAARAVIHRPEDVFALWG